MTPRLVVRGAAVFTVASAAVILPACGDGTEVSTPSDVPERMSPGTGEIPAPDLADMEPRVQYILRDAHKRVREALTSADEWGRYAMVLDAHELYDEARHAYRVATRLAPRDFRWHYLLSRVLELQGADTDEPGAVESALEEALRLNESYAPLFVRLGALYARTGRPDEARSAYARAEQLDGASLPARIGTARSMLAAGETDAALAKAEALAADHPDDWETQMLLARAYAVGGRRDEARRAADRARELPQKAEYPDPVVGAMMNYAVSATACYKRARSLSAAGDFENALMNLKVVVEVRPDYAPGHERMAWCAHRLGKLKVARRHYRRAVELAPDMEPAHRGLADVLAELGDGEGATEARARADSLIAAG